MQLNANNQVHRARELFQIIVKFDRRSVVEKIAYGQIGVSNSKVLVRVAKAQDTDGRNTDDA